MKNMYKDLDKAEQNGLKTMRDTKICIKSYSYWMGGCPYDSLFYIEYDKELKKYRAVIEVYEFSTLNKNTKKPNREKSVASHTTIIEDREIFENILEGLFKFNINVMSSILYPATDGGANELIIEYPNDNLIRILYNTDAYEDRNGLSKMIYELEKYILSIDGINLKDLFNENT